MNKETNRGEEFQVDLTNCDREPIHILNLTQAHGVLIALDADLNIAQISENCRELFGRQSNDLLGKPLDSLLRILTASNNPRDVTYCYRHGANGCQIKTVGFEKFFGSIQMMIKYWFETATIPATLN